MKTNRKTKSTIKGTAKLICTNGSFPVEFRLETDHLLGTELGFISGPASTLAKIWNGRERHVTLESKGLTDRFRIKGVELATKRIVICRRHPKTAFKRPAANTRSSAA